MNPAHSKTFTALPESARFVQSIFMASSTGMALFDTDLHIIEANAALGKVIGYSIEELRRMDMMEELITDKRLARPVLENSDKMHRLLAKDLLFVLENERRNVVLELHDVIGGNLGAAKFLLEKIKQQGESHLEIDNTVVNKLTTLIDDTLYEVQRLSTSLRPPGLDDMGIFAALKWLIRKHNQIYPDTATTLECFIAEADIPPAIKLDLFRIVQEALNNCAKHSQATHIEVSLRKSDNKIVLAIVDNGVGFNPENLSFETANGGLGLRNMRCRAELSNGTMTICSQAGSGTTLHIEWDCLTSFEQ